MQFSEQFILVLDELCKRFGLVIDWTAQNVMPYLQDLSSRIISYEIAKHISFILLFVVAVFAVKKIIKLVPKYDSERNKAYGIKSVSYECACWISVVVLMVTFIWAVLSVFDIIKCVFLPEVILYGYIKPLL